MKLQLSKSGQASVEYAILLAVVVILGVDTLYHNGWMSSLISVFENISVNIHDPGNEYDRAYIDQIVNTLKQAVMDISPLIDFNIEGY